MKPLAERLFNMIEEQGWKGSIVSISHLAELRNAIIGRYEDGLIEKTLYRKQLGFFSFDPPSDLSGANSIIVVAIPTPQMRIVFNWQGNRIPVIVPPIYISYTPRTEYVQALLAKWLRHEGYSISKPRLPLKTLAVCSGLAEYGRNNICYVPGMGSFIQLVAVLSDLPCDTDPWREPKQLDRCQTCVACIRHCPTAAITKDRFLLYAERCLTYHNESANDFPDWINPLWHHCLIGCMRCQTACSENSEVKNWYKDRAEFSEQETGLFIKGVPPDQLPDETYAKMKSLEINEDYRLLCRNLSLIIEQGRSKS
jgi:epoxyqueuosine reductase